MVLIQNNKLNNLLKVLKNEINDINLIYKETQKDPYKESGIEYNKSYDFDEYLISKRKLNEHIKLININIDKLYERILNFTQTYYSIKELLVKLNDKPTYPQQNKIVNNYFSNEKILGKSRIDICNQLKHNPKQDLQYKRKLRREKIRTKTGIKVIYRNEGSTWFYNEIDSVQFCNLLFLDLKTFLEKNLTP